MDSNRFGEALNALRPPGIVPLAAAAFVVCPIVADAWCAALYQLAFQQAQAVVSAPPRGRELFAIMN
jgi:hypothetical protein